jgi:hypothetical protein
MEKAGMLQEIEEMQNLEMSDLLLLLFSSGSEAPDSNQQLQQASYEWVQLQTQVGETDRVAETAAVGERPV